MARTTLIIGFTKRPDQGCGIEITRADGHIRVTAIREESPARQTILQVGDVLYTANGFNIQSLSIEEIASILKAHTQVVMEVGRSQVIPTNRNSSAGGSNDSQIRHSINGAEGRRLTSEVIDLVSSDEDEESHQPTSSGTSLSLFDRPILSGQKRQRPEAVKLSTSVKQEQVSAEYKDNRNTNIFGDSDDEEVMIIDNPNPTANVTHHHSNTISVSEDDIEFVGGNLSSAVEMPHQREACTTFKFSPPPQSHVAASLPMGVSSNASHCIFCYCYICDDKASECLEWEVHCHASHKINAFRLERAIRKSPLLESLGPSGLRRFFKKHGACYRESLATGQGSLARSEETFFKKIFPVICNMWTSLTSAEVSSSMSSSSSSISAANGYECVDSTSSNAIQLLALCVRTLQIVRGSFFNKDVEQVPVILIDVLLRPACSPATRQLLQQELNAFDVQFHTGSCPSSVLALRNLVRALLGTTAGSPGLCQWLSGLGQHGSESNATDAAMAVVLQKLPPSMLGMLIQALVAGHHSSLAIAAVVKEAPPSVRLSTVLSSAQLRSMDRAHCGEAIQSTYDAVLSALVSMRQQDENFLKSTSSTQSIEDVAARTDTDPLTVVVTVVALKRFAELEYSPPPLATKSALGFSALHIRMLRNLAARHKLSPQSLTEIGGFTAQAAAQLVRSGSLVDWLKSMYITEDVTRDSSTSSLTKVSGSERPELGQAIKGDNINSATACPVISVVLVLIWHILNQELLLNTSGRALSTISSLIEPLLRTLGFEHCILISVAMNAALEAVEIVTATDAKNKYVVHASMKKMASEILKSVFSISRQSADVRFYNTIPMAVWRDLASLPPAPYFQSIYPDFPVTRNITTSPVTNDVFTLMAQYFVGFSGATLLRILTAISSLTSISVDARYFLILSVIWKGFLSCLTANDAANIFAAQVHNMLSYRPPVPAITEEADPVLWALRAVDEIDKTLSRTAVKGMADIIAMICSIRRLLAGKITRDATDAKPDAADKSLEWRFWRVALQRILKLQSLGGWLSGLVLLEDLEAIDSVLSPCDSTASSLCASFLRELQYWTKGGAWGISDVDKILQQFPSLINTLVSVMQRIVKLVSSSQIKSVCDAPSILDVYVSRSYFGLTLDLAQITLSPRYIAKLRVMVAATVPSDPTYSSFLSPYYAFMSSVRDSVTAALNEESSHRSSNIVGSSRVSDETIMLAIAINAEDSVVERVLSVRYPRSILSGPNSSSMSSPSSNLGELVQSSCSASEADNNYTHTEDITGKIAPSSPLLRDTGCMSVNVLVQLLSMAQDKVGLGIIVGFIAPYIIDAYLADYTNMTVKMSTILSEHGLQSGGADASSTDEAISKMNLDGNGIAASFLLELLLYHESSATAMKRFSSFIVWQTASMGNKETVKLSAQKNRVNRWFTAACRGNIFENNESMRCACQFLPVVLVYALASQLSADADYSVVDTTILAPPAVFLDTKQWSPSRRAVIVSWVARYFIYYDVAQSDVDMVTAFLDYIENMTAACAGRGASTEPVLLSTLFEPWVQGNEKNDGWRQNELPVPRDAVELLKLLVRPHNASLELLKSSAWVLAHKKAIDRAVIKRAVIRNTSPAAFSVAFRVISIGDSISAEYATFFSVIQAAEFNYEKTAAVVEELGRIITVDTLMGSTGNPLSNSSSFVVSATGWFLYLGDMLQSVVTVVGDDQNLQESVQAMHNLKTGILRFSDRLQALLSSRKDNLSVHDLVAAYLKACFAFSVPNMRTLLDLCSQLEDSLNSPEDSAQGVSVDYGQCVDHIMETYAMSAFSPPSLAVRLNKIKGFVALCCGGHAVGGKIWSIERRLSLMLSALGCTESTGSSAVSTTSAATAMRELPTRTSVNAGAPIPSFNIFALATLPVSDYQAQDQSASVELMRILSVFLDDDSLNSDCALVESVSCALMDYLSLSSWRVYGKDTYILRLADSVGEDDRWFVEPKDSLALSVKAFFFSIFRRAPHLSFVPYLYELRYVDINARRFREAFQLAANVKLKSKSPQWLEQAWRGVALTILSSKLTDKSNLVFRLSHTSVQEWLNIFACHVAPTSSVATNGSIPNPGPYLNTEEASALIAQFTTHRLALWSIFSTSAAHTSVSFLDAVAKVAHIPELCKMFFLENTPGDMGRLLTPNNAVYIMPLWTALISTGLAGPCNLIIAAANGVVLYFRTTTVRQDLRDKFEKLMPLLKAVLVRAAPPLNGVKLWEDFKQNSIKLLSQKRPLVLILQQN